MRALATGDWHSDWTTDGFDRYVDVVSASEQMLRDIERLRIDEFWHLGDLTDPFTPGVHRAIGHMVQFVAELNKRTVQQRIIVGNHDIVEDGLGTHTMHALDHSRFPFTEVYDTPRVEETEHYTLIALPFTSYQFDYDPVQVVQDAEVDAKKPVIVLSHLQIEGIEQGSESLDMLRGRNVLLPLEAIRARWPEAIIVNGHHHHQQCFKGIFCTGGLLRFTHGEEAFTPGYLILEF